MRTHSSKLIQSLSILVLAAAIFAAGNNAIAQQVPEAPLKKYGISQAIPDRYIVVFKDGVKNPKAETENMMRGLRGEVHFIYSTAIKGFAATLPGESLEALRRNPNVEYIEVDATVSINATQSGATWGLDRIDQRDLPLNSSYVYNATGTGVYAFILDTGILASHREFSGRVSLGATAIHDGRGSTDCNGHGTHVAGTVGGNSYGVAKSVTLVPVRVLGCDGSGSWSGVIAGIDWVARQTSMRPAVANMSLGGGANSSIDTAVANAVSMGVTMVVAAGNDNRDACSFSPAREPSAITVGATTSSDARASYSNRGSCLDVFAPGSSITSAWYTGDLATVTISGTSMASPHVAGAATLILEANPSLTPAQVTKAILDASTAGKVTSAGTGSPNRLLFSNFGGGTTAANAPPTASFTSSCTDLSCSFNASASSDDVGITSYAWTFSDGSLGSSVTISHEFGEAGTYNVNLTVTDNNGATGTQSQSVTVSSPQVVTKPEAPSSLTLTVVSKNRIDLRWSDNSINETGFKIERSTDGSQWSPLATTLANVKSYSSTGLKSRTRYYYRIRATNSGGDSAYSNTESAVTK